MWEEIQDMPGEIFDIKEEDWMAVFDDDVQESFDQETKKLLDQFQNRLWPLDQGPDLVHDGPSSHQTMTDRLQLTIRWVREHCDFLRIEATEPTIARVQFSVSQLTDAEVAQFLAETV